MRWFRFLCVLLCVALCACSPSKDTAAQKTNAPAVSLQYDVLATPGKVSTEKVEVVEFFAYFCSHCRSFDSALTAWAKEHASTVDFIRVPMVFRDSMLARQRLYYTLEVMGELEPMHAKTFDAKQVERVDLDNEAEIIAFVTREGMDVAQFKQVYHSLAVAAKMKKAAALQEQYPAKGIPEIMVDRHFKTSVPHASHRPNVEQTEEGLQKATLEIMDELVEKAQALRAQ